MMLLSVKALPRQKKMKKIVKNQTDRQTVGQFAEEVTGSPATRIVPVDAAAACRAYRDPGARLSPKVAESLANASWSSA